MISSNKSISEWQKEVHALAKEKGWWPELDEDSAEFETKVNLAAIAVMHLHLSQHLERIRDGQEPSEQSDEEAEEAVYAIIDKLTAQQIDLLSRIALVHSELSEAVEAIVDGGNYAIRLSSPSGKPEGAVVELADAAIRIMDLCGAGEWPLELAIAVKHNFNKTRPFRHGGKKA